MGRPERRSSAALPVDSSRKSDPEKMNPFDYGVTEVRRLVLQDNRVTLTAKGHEMGCLGASPTPALTNSLSGRSTLITIAAITG
jgi:hypothetical protein